MILCTNYRWKSRNATSSGATESSVAAEFTAHETEFPRLLGSWPVESVSLPT